jgi:hypothetical protein
MDEGIPNLSPEIDFVEILSLEVHEGKLES